MDLGGITVLVLEVISMGIQNLLRINYCNLEDGSHDGEKQNGRLLDEMPYLILFTTII